MSSSTNLGAEPALRTIVPAVDEAAVFDGIKRLKKERALLLAAARLARSTIASRAVLDLAERTAIQKLSEAIVIAEQGQVLQVRS